MERKIEKLLLFFFPPRKEILSRLADIQATRNAIAQSRQQSSDVPDAPPSYDEAVASSSTIYPNPTAQPAMPSTQPMPYATPSSSYASIIDSRSQTPSYGECNYLYHDSCLISTK
jgi:hypothetical protein